MGNNKTIPIKDFAHIKGIESRTILIGALRGKTKFAKSKEGLVMHFGAYEYLVLDASFEDGINCESGYSRLNLIIKLSDLTHDINEYCLSEDDS